MSTDERTLKTLKQSGHRLTPQRLMILSVLRDSAGHLSAAEILEQVKRDYPYIDISTVYRTLGVLKDMRLVSETDMGGGEYRYEWVDEVRHHHLICADCDSVTQMDHKYTEDLGAAILDDYGFQANIDHFAIFGQCARCRQRSVAWAAGLAR